MTAAGTLFGEDGSPNPDAIAAKVAHDSMGAFGKGQPDTSRLAALGVKTGSQRAAVLSALVAAGEEGATDFELSRAIGHPRPHVAGTRRKELVDLGLAAATDLRRPTDTGHAAVVWVVTDLGRVVDTRVNAAAA